MNVAEKYWWVHAHPKLNPVSGWSPLIEIEPHMVNDTTVCVENEESLNNNIRYWIELMYYDVNTDVVPNRRDFIPIRSNMTYVHAWKCDCGGWTADEAIERLYELVLKEYGDY